jgi:hypothetical protein
LSFAEVVVALGMATVVVAVGSLSLGSLGAFFSLDNGSRSLAMALSQARVFAITRGRDVTVTFGSTSFVAQTTGSTEPLISGELPSHVTLEATGAAAFSPLGTVATPVQITLDRSGETRHVHVRLTGEVEIQ